MENLPPLSPQPKPPNSKCCTFYKFCLAALPLVHIAQWHVKYSNLTPTKLFQKSKQGDIDIKEWSVYSLHINARGAASTNASLDSGG